MEKALARYLRWQKSEGHSPRTVQTHKLYIEYFIKWCVDNDLSTDIKDLHIETVREYIEYMQDRELSDATVNTRVRSLRAWTHWLADEDWLEKDPLAKLKPPRVSDKIKKILDPKDVDRLLATCNKELTNGLRDAAIILLLYSTGIRSGELIGLHRDDIDYEQGLILIRRGKGGKSRVVPLGSKADRAISRYLAQRTDDLPYLFLTDEGTQVSYSTLRQLVRRKSDKIGKHVHLHLFRHSFAVQYLRNGGKLETLKSIMGHTTYEMTLHYARVAGVDVVAGHEIADPTKSLKSR